MVLANTLGDSPRNYGNRPVNTLNPSCFYYGWPTSCFIYTTAWSSEQSTLDGKSYLRVENRASLSGKRGRTASHRTTITRSSTIQPICYPNLHPVVELVQPRC